jgi:uncharacterized protein YraI
VPAKLVFSILIFFLLSTACVAPQREASVPTATEFLVTSTLSASATFRPSETALPAPQPTIVPIQGTTSTQINVRSDASTAGTVLGMIPANTIVDILGKDPGGNWLQIIYPQAEAVDGKGWVTAQYVVVANGAEIPVIGGNRPNPTNGNVAIVQQQINVRSGPGTSFNSLGILNPQDVVNLTGKDANGAWLQIEFAAGPEGKGWVNAQFVQANGVENVPTISEAGEVIGTGTPTGIPATVTPTLIPAWMDNDSQNNPVASVVFEPFGTHTLIYTGDVSSPGGDAQDWIQFTPASDHLFATLECQNGSKLQVNFLENGQSSDLELACGARMKELEVRTGVAYLVQLQAPQAISSLEYIRYTITIQASP